MGDGNHLGKTNLNFRNRARLLKTDIKDTRENSRVFFYFKWFCPLSWETESRANFDFAEYGFRYEKRDRKSTRLNSSHVAISYAVFCLKKKNYDNAYSMQLETIY